MKLNTIAKISMAAGVALFATIGANLAPAQASSVPSSTTFVATIVYTPFGPIESPDDPGENSGVGSPQVK